MVEETVCILALVGSQNSQASAPYKSLEIEAVKILADGTRIPLGVVSSWHRNPLIRVWWRVKHALKRRLLCRSR